jgi:hypothetical protein
METKEKGRAMRGLRALEISSTQKLQLTLLTEGVEPRRGTHTDCDQSPSACMTEPYTHSERYLEL